MPIKGFVFTSSSASNRNPHLHQGYALGFLLPAKGQISWTSHRQARRSHCEATFHKYSFCRHVRCKMDRCFLFGWLSNEVINTGIKMDSTSYRKGFCQYLVDWFMYDTCGDTHLNISMTSLQRLRKGVLRVPIKTQPPSLPSPRRPCPLLALATHFAPSNLVNCRWRCK